MKCQGRPENGLCPDNRNDSSVHNTIGDLFLCHACEEYRWPSKPTAGKTAPSNKHTAKQSSKPATMKPAKANKNSHPALTDSDRMDKVGGNTTTCGRCLEMIDVNMTVRCDICETVLDQECAGIPNDVFEVLLTIIHDSSWVCSDCRNERQSTISKLRAELSTINQVVANMKQMMEGLRSDVDGLRTSGATSEQHITTPYTTPKPSGTSDFAVEVCRTVSDMCKRKKNIVISGLPEISTESNDESDIKQLEEQAFNKFCEENLTVKPSVAVMGCRRLGKKTDKPRRLLVHLTTEQNAQDVLLSARSVLRKNPDHYIATSVYVNQDLTAAQAKLAFQQRQRRRVAKLKSQAVSVAPSADAPGSDHSHILQDSTSIVPCENMCVTAEGEGNDAGVSFPSHQSMGSTEPEDCENDQHNTIGALHEAATAADEVLSDVPASQRLLRQRTTAVQSFRRT